MLLLPATLINKRDSPKNAEFHACASISKPQINYWLQLLLVVYFLKLCLTSFKCNLMELLRNEELLFSVSIHVM